jgi:hypothetical protein
MSLKKEERGVLKDWEEKGNKLRATNYTYLDKLLDTILQRVSLHINDPSYSGQIDSSEFHFKNIFCLFEFGNIFSKNRKHLLVKRFINEYDGSEMSLFSDIYILSNNTFIKLFADTANTGYREESLTDVNLDGFKDYIISSYSGTGCCPRDERIAYLYDNKRGDFKKVDFFNPEFDNAQHIVYESEYGYQGEVSIDKYKWDGLSKVEVESIYPNRVRNTMFSFIKPYSFTRIKYPGGRKQIIKNVPAEYKKLDIYEYFISYQK